MTGPTFREDIPLRPVSRLVLAGLCLLPISGALSVAFVAPGNILFVAIGLPVLLAIVMLVVIRPNRVAVADGGLDLRAGLARYRLPLSALYPASLREIDLKVSAELRPRWRKFGTALPGPFWGGWFGLRDHRRAFVLVNRTDRITCVTARDGTFVLLSLRDTDGFRRALSRG